MECTVCPRNCKAKRIEKNYGFCGVPNEPVVARAALHHWEEPVISGVHGSGTVFFSGCPLRCVFCQNAEIAEGFSGKKISEERLVEIFFELKEKGANNINLVTPTHYIPVLERVLIKAKKQGLTLPIIYNTGAYEKVEQLKRLEGLVDVYLPDLKYVSSALSKKYSHAEDYFVVASQAISEMFRQTKAPQFYRERKNEREVNYQTVEYDGEENFLIKKGVIVRHLLLPGCVEDSKNVLRYLHDTYGENIYISIMNQYTPHQTFTDYLELNRKVTEEEYEELVDFAIDIGVENGFIQEGDTAQESFIPTFNCEGV